MPRASHRGTCKPDGIRVNEDSKLKSEVYEGAKAIPLPDGYTAHPKFSIQSPDS